MEKRKQLSIIYGYMSLTVILGEALFGFGFTAFMYNRGLSIAMIGMLSAIADFSMMILDYPTGNLADKYGRKKIAGIGFLIYGMGYIVFALSQGFTLFATAAIIRALGASLISGAPVSWYIGELHKIGEYDYKDHGISSVRGVSFLVGSGAGVVAASLTDISLALPILMGGVLLIASGCITLICFEDNYGKGEHHNLWKQIIHNTKEIVANKDVHSLATYKFFSSVLFITFILLWQVFATEVIGIKYKMLGYLYSTMLIIMSLSSFTTRRLLKTQKGTHITITSIFITVFGVFLFVFWQTTLGFLVGFLCIEIGFGFMNASYSTWVHDYIPEKSRSSYLSALSSVVSLSSFLLAILIGWLVEIFGFSTGWIVGAIAHLFSAYFLWKLTKTQPKSYKTSS